jgi:hypothetical protein
MSVFFVNKPCKNQLNVVSVSNTNKRLEYEDIRLDDDEGRGKE